MSIEETQPALVEALQERLLKEIGRATADAPRNAKDLSIALGVAIDKLPVLEDVARLTKEVQDLRVKTAQQLLGAEVSDLLAGLSDDPRALAVLQIEPGNELPAGRYVIRREVDDSN